MNKIKSSGAYSQEKLCSQLHALYDLLQARKKAILADPELNPENDALNNELELIYIRSKLIQECFEHFCPS